MDFQVKINGQRVELGEIESKVLEMSEIQQCVVINVKKENGKQYLVCYYIPNKNEKEIINKIRKYLTEKLPIYMIPNYYIRINEIPLSSTGKLNRRGLPEPREEDFITETYVAPMNNIEKIICKIYDDVFNISGIKIGRMHDFYELGGDSLNAIRISSRIEKELKIKIYIKDIMSHPKIYDLSGYIESVIKDEKNENMMMMEIIEKRNKKEFPITSQQLGVYNDSIKEENNMLYNIPNVYKLNDNVDKERIKKAFLKIFDEQEILRSRYYVKEINGKMEIYGTIDDECSLKFEEYSYENVERFIRPFELDKAPLIRVGFIKNEVLLIDMHHIICDGATNIIIMDELNKYYNEEEVEKLDIQYSDYAIYLKEKKKDGKLNEQIELYKEIFSNEYEILNIPNKSKITKNEYNVKEEYNSEEYNQNNKIEKLIDKATSERINEFIRHHNISKTALFISVYGYVLSKYSGQDTIYTSMMSANRNNHYVENMAGMFVSTLPLLLKYNKEEQRFIEVIKENMELLNNIYKNQDISFAELTEILKLKKMNNSFIFHPNISNKNNGNQSNSIFSTFENNGNMELNSLFGIENLLKNNNKSKFEIIFNVIENENNCYKIYIEYNNVLYDSIMIKRILDSYIEIMKNINSLENNNIRNIEYIPMDEKERIIKQFNYDVNKEGCDKLYHEEFRKIAGKCPKRNAIIFNEMKITYKELDEMTNSLAYYLRLERVKRNDIIPIICDRSPYYIIGILGISKAGGAFLPIDKNLPNERIQFILGEIKSKVILFSNCEEVINKLKNNEENTEYKMYDLVKHDYSNN
eukprot:jgi/Orpsp1_1/1192571/evm.model.d7180000094319.1